MKGAWLTLLGCLMFLFQIRAQGNGVSEVRKNVLLDSIRLSDPFILADHKTKTYYMTGTGGVLCKSKDLKFWEGPYSVAQIDSNPYD